MTKKLLKNKFILELNETVSSAQASEMEEDSTKSDMILDDDDEDEEEEEDLSSSSSINSSTSPPLSSTNRLIHPGSHPQSEELNNDSPSATTTTPRDFLLFRKMTSEAATAAAAAAAAAISSSPSSPVVPTPLRQADFFLPSSPLKSSFHPGFSDHHWKALTSLYNSHYYPPPPFFAGKFSPLFSPSIPRIEDRLGSLAAFSSPFQPPTPPLRSFHPPTSSSSSPLEFRSPLWSFDPLKRNRSLSPSNKESHNKRYKEGRGDIGRLVPDCRISSLGLDSSGDKRFSTLNIDPSRTTASSPPAMKRYKRERLVLPASCTLTKDQIIHMPIDQFNDYLARSNFTEEELSRLKDARRKGKNRVAARRSRDHRLREVQLLKSRKIRVVKEKSHVDEEYENSIEDCKSWERIYDLFQYHIKRFVDEQNGIKGHLESSNSNGMSPDILSTQTSSMVVSSRAFNPPLVLNSC